MEYFETPKGMQEIAAELKCGSRIGLVPTMGFLHDGHLSLINRAREECDILVVSIFVNPAQFGPDEDLDEYPRDMKRDEELCREAGVDIIFAPEPGDMYPEGYCTKVAVSGLTERLCGQSRPTHFDGVTTVVARLFNIVEPDVAVFGQKDFQQSAVVRRMTRDLNIPVEIIVAPTLRQDDGLALSSRNRYLTDKERKQAPGIYRALKSVKEMIEAGEIESGEKAGQILREKIESAGDFQIDYAEAVDRESLKPAGKLSGKSGALVVAAGLGKARLIDNLFFEG